MREASSVTTDLICGMTVDEASASHAERDEETFYFCSDHCRQEFLSASFGAKPEGTSEAGADNSGSVTLISLYRKRAQRYDWSTLLLYFAGFRHRAYRRRAIQSLALNHDDTVVDLGCGTGLNFSLLQDQVGPRGKIIGVDLTDAMLDAANARIAAHGWSNVELVKSDAAAYVFPSAVEGILSTFALTLVPEFDEVVRNGAVALRPGRRFVILDFKRPSGWLMNKAAPLIALLLTGPFGGTLEMASRKPWRSLEKHLALVQFRDLYLGGAYIAVAENPRVSGGEKS